MNYYYFLVFLVARALASPNGAPQQACSSMTPGHGYNPQTKSSPFIVLPLTNEIMQSSFVPIGLSSVTDDYFRGFLVMAFDNDGEPIGRFSDEGDFRFMDCSNGTNVYVNVNNAVTHSTNADKMFVRLNWMPPSYFTGPVHFRATFVKNVSHYWVNINSSVVNVIPFTSMPSSAEVNFANSTISLLALPLLLLALIAAKF
uniref:Reelin domain-containing protein n=1 Tax=Daphnia galeata TaxID=27404 RepID=A0A8J2RG53_9CRUS|nr:unnamed protein product [Daphnia galeata]